MVNGRLECREIQEKHLLQVWLDPGSPVLPLGFPLWSSLLSWLFFSDKILRVAPKMAPRPWYLPRYRNSEGERPSFPTPVSIPFREFSLIPLDSCSHWSRDHWWQWPIWWITQLTACMGEGHLPEGSNEKVDKASLLGPHCSLCRISGTALDLQRRQSGRPLTRSSKMLWVMCPSHSILLHWVNARGRWMVRYSFIENREGMRVRKWGEYQVGDLRQKRAWSTYKDRKKIPHD